MTKVIDLPCITRLDLPPERILKSALKDKVTDVIVLGWDQNDGFYFASSKADGGHVIYMLEMAKKMLLESGEDQ